MRDHRSLSSPCFQCIDEFLQRFGPIVTNAGGENLPHRHLHASGHGSPLLRFDGRHRLLQRVKPSQRFGFAVGCFTPEMSPKIDDALARVTVKVSPHRSRYATTRCFQ